MTRLGTRGEGGAQKVLLAHLLGEGPCDNFDSSGPKSDEGREPRFILFWMLSSNDKDVRVSV